MHRREESKQESGTNANERKGGSEKGVEVGMKEKKKGRSILC